MIDLDDVLPPLDRLLALAARNTGQSRHAADFLLAWWNAASCGGFDLTTLWAEQPKVPRASARGMAAEGVDRAVADDMIAVLRLIALRHQYPTAYGRGPQFEALVERWRPALVKAGS